jgi:DNA helicase HerA-like ATPase
VKATAQTMRPKPGLDIEQAISELAVGEALVSLLDSKGRPSVTERAFVIPPGSQIGPITPAQRQALMQSSLVAGVYEKAVDRESAYEKLTAKIAQPAPAPADAPPPPPAPEPERRREEPSVVAEVLGSPVVKSFLRSAASALGREITRGLFGTRRRR